MNIPFLFSDGDTGEVFGLFTNDNEIIDSSPDPVAFGLAPTKLPFWLTGFSLTASAACTVAFGVEYDDGTFVEQHRVSLPTDNPVLSHEFAGSGVYIPCGVGASPVLKVITGTNVAISGDVGLYPNTSAVAGELAPHGVAVLEAGDYSFKFPAGVSTITVKAWGPGGTGGSGRNSDPQPGDGAGGGGSSGAYAEATIPATSLPLRIHVGTGAARDATTIERFLNVPAGENGGDYGTGAVLVPADPVVYGGAVLVDYESTTAGVGGDVSSVLHPLATPGGDGGTSPATGSGAGATGDTDGGAAGATPGGGGAGGGAGASGDTAVYTGGVGGNGRVILEW